MTMPRRYKKKTTRKRKGYQLTRMGVPSGIPSVRTAKLRYAELVSITCTSGALGSYVFKANDIYDPNYTGTGHQPMGRDTWANLYNHYVVVGSKLSAHWGVDTASSGPAMFGVFLDDSTVAGYTDASSFIEAGKGTHRFINGRNGGAITTTSKFSARKFFNIEDMKDNVARLGATVTSSPTEDACYHLWYQTMDASSDTYQVMVIIDYIVQFSEPKSLAQS